MNKKYFLIILLISLAVSSCILVPAIDSIKKAGITSSDRKELLSRNIKLFHDALHWGNVNDAMVFASPEKADKIAEYLQNTSEDKKIVESKVKNVIFDEDAYTATVTIKTKAFRIPVYVVEETTEEETWKCTLTDNWKIYDIKNISKK